jgi:phage terminase large subunit-like protein
MTIERVLFVNPFINGVTPITPVMQNSLIAPESLKVNKVSIDPAFIKQFKNSLKANKVKLRTNKIKIDIAAIKQFKNKLKNK